MFTDIEIHRAAKLYVPQCRRSAVAGARSSLYRGLDSMRERSWEESKVVILRSYSETGYAARGQRSVRRRRCSALRRDRAIAFRPAVAEKLPHFTPLGDHVQIEIRNYDFILIAACLCDDLASRIAEITLAIEFADAPGLLGANAIDRSHKVAVGHGVRRLFEFPQVFRESGHGGGRIENDLGAIQSQDARPFRKMAIITNVHTHAGVLRFKNRI